MDIGLAVLSDLSVWLALVSLTVLGVDNVVFIAVMARRLGSEDKAKSARIIG